MRGKRTLKILFFSVFFVVLLIPAILSTYLIYRVDKLEERILSLSVDKEDRNDMEASVEAALQGELQEQEKVPDSETELDLKADADLLENKLSWDIAKSNADAWDSNTGMRKVYLTFDDGPSRNTNKILDILNEYGVKATFFVVGKDGFEEEYQRIVAEGHTLGMHSFSHKYQEIYQSVDSYTEDLNKIQAYLYQMTGETSRIVRFPGGSSNSVSRVDMRDLISYLKKKDIVYFDWNISSGDAGREYMSASQIANNVLSQVMKYDSAIVLMHDSADRNSTVQALPIIIEKILESENTVLLPISDETTPIQHIQ